MELKIGDKVFVELFGKNGEHDCASGLHLTINQIVPASPYNDKEPALGFEGVSTPGMGPVWPARFFIKDGKRCWEDAK